MHHPVLEITLLILLMVLLVNMTFRVVRIPIILGYLLAGVVVGPELLGWVADVEAIRSLAEFGVVLLMFTIGLEFSLSKLMTLRYAVFILGGLQVLICIIVTVLIGFIFSITFRQSLLIGCIVSMSSTALVIKQLSEQSELHTTSGFNALGILLFQDLAVVLMLMVVASLGAGQEQTILQTSVWGVIKGLAAMLTILMLGRWVLRPLFHAISSTNTQELFTLMVLFVALGSAWFTNFLGMTYALGAFLSGIMLAETEYRSKIKEEIRPFRDVLLGLFFVSVGLLANISTWIETSFWIFLTVCALIVGKALLIMILSRVSGYDCKTTIRTGLMLAQGGEFGFAILTFALDKRLIPAAYGQVVLAALLISFAIAPVVLRYNEWIANWCCRVHHREGA